MFFSIHISLIGCFLIPSKRLYIVLWNTPTALIEVPQIVLGSRVSPIGSLAQPGDGGGKIFLNAQPFFIQQSKIVLCDWFAVIRGLSHPCGRLCEAFGDTLPPHVHSSQEGLY